MSLAIKIKICVFHREITAGVSYADSNTSFINITQITFYNNKKTYPNVDLLYKISHFKITYEIV